MPEAERCGGSEFDSRQSWQVESEDSKEGKEEEEKRGGQWGKDYREEELGASKTMITHSFSR